MSLLLRDNQQVAAEIFYEVTPQKTHRAFRASALFNVLGMSTAKLVKRRQWFALDHDAQLEAEINPLIAKREDIANALDEIRGRDPREAIAGARVIVVDGSKLEDIFRGAAGEIRLGLAGCSGHDQVAELIAERVPFPKLADMLTRFNRMLTHEQRGGLLKVDITHCPLRNFSVM